MTPKHWFAVAWSLALSIVRFTGIVDDVDYSVPGNIIVFGIVCGILLALYSLYKNDRRRLRLLKEDWSSMLKALEAMMKTVDRREARAKAERIARNNTRASIQNARGRRIRNLMIRLDAEQVRKAHMEAEISQKACLILELEAKVCMAKANGWDTETIDVDRDMQSPLIKTNEQDTRYNAVKKENSRLEDELRRAQAQIQVFVESLHKKVDGHDQTSSLLDATRESLEAADRAQADLKMEANNLREHNKALRQEQKHLVILPKDQVDVPHTPGLASEEQPQQESVKKNDATHDRLYALITEKELENISLESRLRKLEVLHKETVLGMQIQQADSVVRLQARHANIINELESKHEEAIRNIVAQQTEATPDPLENRSRAVMDLEAGKNAIAEIQTPSASFSNVQPYVVNLQKDLHALQKKYDNQSEFLRMADQRLSSITREWNNTYMIIQEVNSKLPSVMNRFGKTRYTCGDEISVLMKNDPDMKIKNGLPLPLVIRRAGYELTTIFGHHYKFLCNFSNKLTEKHGDVYLIANIAHKELIGSTPFPQLHKKPAIFGKATSYTQAMKKPTSLALLGANKLPANPSASRPTEQKQDVFTCSICQNQFPNSSARWYFDTHLKICRSNNPGRKITSLAPAAAAFNSANVTPLFGLGAITPLASPSTPAQPAKDTEKQEGNEDEDKDKSSAAAAGAGSKGGLMGGK